MKGEHLGEFEEFTLLAIRAVGDDTYAVPLQQYIEEATGRTVSLGAVYSALTRLEEKGYVRSSMSGAIAARGGEGAAHVRGDAARPPDAARPARGARPDVACDR